MHVCRPSSACFQARCLRGTQWWSKSTYAYRIKALFHCHLPEPAQLVPYSPAETFCSAVDLQMGCPRHPVLLPAGRHPFKCVRTCHSAFWMYTAPYPNPSANVLAHVSPAPPCKKPWAVPYLARRDKRTCNITVVYGSIHATGAACVNARRL